MSGETDQRTKVLRVATRCVSIEQFVEAFARYCQKRTLFIASMTTRSPGSQSPFVILLADGAQAMRGTCEVVEAWATPAGPFRRPGVRVKFLQLDAASESVLVRLHAFAPAPPVAPKPPVLPPLPPLRPIGIPMTRLPALPPMPGKGKATVAVAAVPPPPPPPLVAIAPPRAPSPPSIATIPPLLDEVKTAPAPAPPDDEPKTDVDASPDALRAIREATAAKAAAPDSPFEDLGTFEAKADDPRTAHDTDPPPVEERAPGSPYILPANPLTGITDENLRGFVECTLYEETGKFTFDDLLERTGEDSDESPIAEPPLPPELKPIPRRDQTPPPAPPAPAPPPEPEPPLPAPMMMPMAPPPPPEFAPPIFTAPVHAVHEFHLPVDLDPPEPPPRPAYGPMIVGLAAAAIIGGIAVYLVMRGSATNPPAVAAASSSTDAATIATPPPTPPAGDAAPIAEAPTDAAPAPVEPVAPVDDTGAVPEPPDRDPIIATVAGDCRVNLRTTPPGATVRHEGRKLGETPLTANLPCGRARIKLTRSRYADVERVISLDAGTAETISISLERPPHRLKLASTPGGATVSIDGRKVGTTPTTITVPGFQTVDVEMRRAGFRTLRARHYSRKDGGVFAARLQKGS